MPTIARFDFQAAISRGSAFSCWRLLFGRSSAAGESVYASTYLRTHTHTRIHAYSCTRVRIQKGAEGQHFSTGTCSLNKRTAHVFSLSARSTEWKTKERNDTAATAANRENRWIGRQVYLRIRTRIPNLRGHLELPRASLPSGMYVRAWLDICLCISWCHQILMSYAMIRLLLVIRIVRTIWSAWALHLWYVFNIKSNAHLLKYVLMRTRILELYR